MEKNAEYGGQPEILAQVYAIKRPITVNCEDSGKGTVSLYIYHFSTVIDFSSEKYGGSTGHRNSWYQ